MVLLDAFEKNKEIDILNCKFASVNSICAHPPLSHTSTFTFYNELANAPL